MCAPLLSQEDYYPPESFYGGGVGFSQMFLFQNLGQLKSFEMLGGQNSFGFDLTKFSSPFILYGGEGFSNITEKIRIGGLVKKNSLSKNKTFINFIITDNENEIVVTYQGLVPNLFSEGKGVVAEGLLKDKKYFIAEKIIAKHDENYMPPEVSDILKN